MAPILSRLTSGSGGGFGFGKKGGSSGPLLGSQSNPATSAQAIINAGASIGDGYYWIKTTSGMANPVQVWCDMTSQTGVGWMRFWWYGRYEITGSDPVSGDFQEQDQLGIADISTIAYDAVHGRGRIPAGQTINGIMAKGNSTPNPKNGGKLPFAIWTASSPGNIPGSSTNTEYYALLAFQSGTTQSSASNSGQWIPSTLGLMTDSMVFASGQSRCDSFYYFNNSGSGYNSFNLDDDYGYCITAFSAGYDAGSTGIDFADNESSCASNSRTRNLVLYWR